MFKYGAQAKNILPLIVFLVLPLLAADYRELHIPAEELPLILESWPEATLLSREEFERLLQDDRRQEEEKPPLRLVFSHLDSLISVQEGRASLELRGQAEVLQAGWHTLELNSEGIAWQECSVAGKPAFCCRSRAGNLALQLAQGRQEFMLQGEIPVQNQDNSRHLQLTLPAGVTGRLRLEAGGDVILKNGPPVLQRTFQPERNVTVFTLLPQRGPLHITLSLNNRFMPGERMLLADCRLLDILGEKDETLTAAVILKVSQQPLPQLRLRIDPAFSVVAVNGQPGLIASWEMQSAHELLIHFSEALSGSTSLEINAIRRQCPWDGAGAPWQFPEFQVLDAYQSSTFAEVRKHPRLQLEHLQGESVLFHPCHLAAKILPPEPEGADAVFLCSFSAPGLYRVSAARVHGAALQIKGSLTADWELAEKEQTLSLRCTLQPLGGELFLLPLVLPPEWKLHPQKPDAIAGQVPVSITSDARQPGHFRLQFPQGVQENQEISVTMNFVAITQDWLAAWSAARECTFPTPDIPGLSWQGGTLNVHFWDSLQGELLALQNCRPLSGRQARTQSFQFPAAPGQLSYRVARLPAQFQAETYSYYKIKGDHLAVTHEITFRLQGAALRHLSFELPEDTPEALAITGKFCQVQEFTAQIKERKKLYTVCLDREFSGPAETLTISYQLPTNITGQRQQLPAVNVPEAETFSGRLAIEGQAEFAVGIHAPLRKIDPGELAAVANPPGQRLLGVYAFNGTAPAVAITVQRQTTFPLPSCLVQHCQATMLCSADGTRQFAVEYILRPNLNALQVRLPDNSLLWSVLLDGKPATLLQQQDTFLVQFPGLNQGQNTRKLLLVYENSAAATGMLGRFNAELPELLYRNAQNCDCVVPIANVAWTLLLPQNYQPLACAGAVTPEQSLTGTAIVPLLARWLYRFSGGINPRHSCLGMLTLPLWAARHKAMMASKLYDKDYRTETELAADHPVDGNMALESRSEEAQVKAPPPASVSGKRVMKAKAPAAAAPSSKLEEKERKPEESQLQLHKSLDINLVRNGRELRFFSLDCKSPFRLTVIEARAWRALRRVCVLLLLLVSFLPSLQSRKRRTWYCLSAMLLSGILPLLPGWSMTASLFNALFLTALGLLPLHGLLALGRRWWCRRRARTAAPLAPTAALLLAVTAAASHGQEPQPQPIPLPKDAVIVPYLPGQPPQQVLLPLELYKHLMLPKTAPAPVSPDCQLTGVAYSCDLGNPQAEDIIFQGEFNAACNRPGPIALPPLPFSGVILEEASINGQSRGFWQKDRPGGRDLHFALPEPGLYQLRLRLSCRVQRQGGWRSATVQLPRTAQGVLQLLNLPEGSEVSLDYGQGIWNTRVTAGTTLRFALPEQAVNIRWRSATGRAEIDPTLTVSSLMGLSLTPARQLLLWQPTFSFQDRGRTVFELEIPADWRVEQISGNNVRGWETLPPAPPADNPKSIIPPGSASLTGLRRKISVRLLKPASEQEVLQLRLLAPGLEYYPQPRTVFFPALTVPDAARHQIMAVIDTPMTFTLHSESKTPLRRIDSAGASEQFFRAFPDQQGLFRPTEAWECSGEPLPLQFALQPSRRPAEARLELIQEITRDGLEVEGKFQVRTAFPGTVQESFALPENFELQSVLAPALLHWFIEPVQGKNRAMLLFADSRAEERRVLFRGRSLRDCRPGQTLPLLAFTWDGAALQHTELAVQTRLPWQLQEKNLQSLQPLLLEQCREWLRRPAPVSLAWQSDELNYAGELAITAKENKISGQCLHGIRLTEAALEETILFLLNLEGEVEEFSFSLPEAWQKVNIQHPAIRSISIEPSPDDPAMRQVRLRFLQAQQGEFLLRLSLDRKIQPEINVRPLPCPYSLQYFLVLENSGRDEIAAVSRQGYEPVLRPVLPRRSELLQGGNFQVWQTSNQSASIVLRCQERPTVETVGASIGLASTILILDASGNCLGEQTYHISNSTEQFLFLRLPPHSRLWTVEVAGEPVKPVIPDGGGAGRVCIPLVKTAEGDLDYQVSLKYSAFIDRPGGARKLEFPFITSENINVERSLLELRLPRDLHWFAFGGNLGQVVAQDQYYSGQLEYQQQQAQRLHLAMQSGNVFSQSRAVHNYAKFNQQIQSDVSRLRQISPQQSAVRNIEQQLQLLEQQVAATTRPQPKSLTFREQCQSLGLLPPTTEPESERGRNWPDSDFTDAAAEASDSDLLRLLGYRQQEQPPRAGVRWRWNEPVQPLLKGGADIAADERLRAVPSGSSELGRQVRSDADQMGTAPSRRLEGAASGRKSEAVQVAPARPKPSPAPAAPVTPPAPPPPATAANQASLQLELPPRDDSRWQVLYFSSPRAVQEVTGRSLSRRSLTAWKNLFALLVLILLAAGIRTIFKRKGLRWLPARLRSRKAMALAGLCGLFFGIFPVLGLLLLLLAGLLCLRPGSRTSSLPPEG